MADKHRPREAVDYSHLVREVFDTCLRVKPKDRVWIQSWDHTLDLARALTSGCSSRACSYLLSIRYEDLWLRSILDGSKEQLSVVGSQEAAALAETEFYIFTLGPRNPIPWSAIPKEKRGMVSVWLDVRYDKTPYAKEWARIASEHRVRMLAIEATLATPERARAQGLNYEEWRNVMFKGCLVDHEKMARRGKVLAKLLSGRGNVRMTTPFGTDLSLELDRRPVGVSDGIAREEEAKMAMVTFLPAGALEVSVKEDSANGTVVYDVPVPAGTSRVDKLKVLVRDGQAIRHEAVAGDGVFQQYLEEGGGGAGQCAFIGFGLNPNLRPGCTQDDKVLGGVTIGFGDNTTKGGKNTANGEWWASMTRATVAIDGMTVLSNGKLLV
ncbi:MAG: aminopeptidase [Conexivisphaerales archaeon]